jgi:hypothetical protein
MTRFVLLAFWLALALAGSGAEAQTTSTQRPTTQAPTTQAPTTTQPFQSLRPSQSACGPGSQSVRVCNDDFRSCNSICNAESFDASFDFAGCGLRCCNQLKACLSIRGCASLSLNCF